MCHLRKRKDKTHSEKEETKTTQALVIASMYLHNCGHINNTQYTKLNLSHEVDQ